MVVRTWFALTPQWERRPFSRRTSQETHLWAMCAITLKGKLYMMEQERAFKAEDALRFL